MPCSHINLTLPETSELPAQNARMLAGTWLKQATQYKMHASRGECSTEVRAHPGWARTTYMQAQTDQQPQHVCA